MRWLAVVLAFGSASSAQTIESARYVDPDTSYSHLVLGLTHNWAAVEVRLNTGAALKLQAPDGLVFEDITPHIIDLDADGQSELMVVESGFGKGARIAVYAFDGVDVTVMASTPHIGQTHRWYAPIGAADLDGDGLVEVAFVDRPHLAKTLRIWRYDPQAQPAFYEIATLANVTNHRIGEDFISSGIRSCGDQAPIFLASGDWRELVEVTVESDAVRAEARGRYTSNALKAALTC